MQTIGILGGMGPEASADVYLKIIQRSYKHARENMDAYPHILINNIPTPNIFQRPNQETGAYLGEQVHILEVAGAKAIGVAWLVDMIDEVARKVAHDGHHQVGVLSSSMSRPLYEHAIAEHSCQTTSLTGSEQESVDQIITSILAGERTSELKDALRSLADNQISRCANCVILGCTDLPIILDQADVPYPLYASNDVLAEVLFDFAIR
jgi:aspartate racemase